MNAKTLKALKASIAKWERNAVAETPGAYLVDYEDCPLCRLFHEEGCIGCPVKERTGREFCSGTPYVRAAHARDAWERDTLAPNKRRGIAHTAALAEVAFLKSLLPSEEPRP